MKIAMIDYIKRGEYDELYKPAYAIKPLLKYLPKNITIWECTDFGESNISKVLKEEGYNVISTNKNQINFLEEKATFSFDMIITNPPYSLKDKFLKRCYEYNKPFAMLLPLTTLEGVQRGQLFKKNGIELLVLDKRVDFNGKGKVWYNTSWYCWKLLPKELIFEELNKEV